MRALWLAVVVALGCAGKADDSGAGGDGVPADWASAHGEVLTPSCGFSSCHGGGAGGFTLDGTDADHARLVGAASVADPSRVLVVAGEADASYLLAKMEGAAGIEGDEMPPGGLLDADRIAIVRAWIDAGAPGP